MDEIKNKLWLLPFAKNFKENKISKLFELGEMIHRNKGEYLSKQFEQSHSFYFLISGKVKFSISIENSKDEFSVGSSNHDFTPIGWSGFLFPYRYATSVTCAKDSVFFEWSHSDLQEFFKKEPDIGYQFVMFVFKKSIILLNQVRTQLTKYNNTDWDLIFSTINRQDINDQVSTIDPMSLLRKSPFFEVFPESLLSRLSDCASMKSYSAGQRLYTQGEDADGIYILAEGKVALCFNKNTIGREIDEEELQKSVYLRMISHSGYLVGWVGLHPGMKNDVTAVAANKTTGYYFGRNALENIFLENPSMSLKFIKRLTWLISNLLRNSRARLISEHFEHEIKAITNIIDQNATQLSVESKLHRLPSLLKQVITHDEAFKILNELKRKGSTLEKGLAKLCLDILGGAHIEHQFYTGLKSVYQTVVDSPKKLTNKDVSIMTTRKFIDIFDKVPNIIEGWENLPDSPGHIFIYNHLVNHSYYMLPNHFNMTLDSNFIKSMVLYRKYGDPGVGVVRIPKAQEYAHQNYYRRLGHIYVYTPQSETFDKTKSEIKQQNSKFFEDAKTYLKNGTNLMISPEGRNFSTADSPGPFKSGAFRLAAMCESEPLIVPLVIANFDKRINNNTYCLIIKKPFKLTDIVKDPLNDKSGLDSFLTDLTDKYRYYVQEVVDLSEKVASYKLDLGSFERKLKVVA